MISMIVLLLAAGAQCVFAGESTSMPALRDTDSTLTIETKYIDKEQVTLISGVEITIYKVADLAVTDGSAKYTLTEDFRDSGVDVNNMTTEEAIAAADRLYAIAVSKELKGKAAVSENGYARFGNVSHGMYLALQTGAVREAENYRQIEPYLLMAPQPLTDVGENVWDYDVVSIPKLVGGDYKPPTTTIEGTSVKGDYEKEKTLEKDGTSKDETTKVKGDYEKKPGKTDGNASTGDDSHIMLCIMMLLLAATAIIIVVAVSRRKRV